jgi:hypothetical protein
MAQVVCTTPEKVKADVLMFLPGSASNDMTGPVMVRWLVAFNSVPPMTKTVADRVLLFSHPVSRTVLAAFFVNGCYTFFTTIGRAEMQQINILLSRMEI